MNTIEINPGEIKISFQSPTAGKISFKDLGLVDEGLTLEGGMLRLVFNLENVGEHHFYSMPTIEIAYDKNVAATHWQCDFNGETILDKIDHHGSKSILLIDRKRLEALEHHHVNELIVHGEFPEPVMLNPHDSSVNLFK